MKSTLVVRRGVTLVEMLVVIAILGILIGLVLVAIQKVRETAVLTQNRNNLRQVILGVHQIASEKEGVVDELLKSSVQSPGTYSMDASLFYRLVPYVHGMRDPTYRPGMSNDEMRERGRPTVKVYRNPADPSWDLEPSFARTSGKCSYAFNMTAMDGSFSLVSSFPDGCSQTIAIGDKYFAKCSSTQLPGSTCNIYDHIFDPHKDELTNKEEVYGYRRPTFADRGWHDVMPVTDELTHTTRPSVPGKTFQVRPRPEDVDPHVLQTTFRAGLTVALFDGSVRTISPTVSETIFWSLVTPAGGEVVSLD